MAKTILINLQNNNAQNFFHLISYYLSSLQLQILLINQTPCVIQIYLNKYQKNLQEVLWLQEGPKQVENKQKRCEGEKMGYHPKV